MIQYVSPILLAARIELAKQRGRFDALDDNHPSKASERMVLHSMLTNIAALEKQEIHPHEVAAILQSDRTSTAA
jgi:hypothetical protein